MPSNRPSAQAPGRLARRARIVATLGPATDAPRVLARLIAAGVDMVRLNLSHGSHQEHRRRVRAVRRIAAALDRHVPVLVDLMGPRYRLAELGAPRVLRKGELVTLGARGRGVDLPIDGAEILRHLRRGERLLIDNGLVELRIEAKLAKSVRGVESVDNNMVVRNN